MNLDQKIPKIIHYCWFGGKPMSSLGIRCLESWKFFLPDYKIIRWDESNFNVNCTRFTSEAYIKKKYAFVSDYVRYKVIYEYGGIYMDTDVEVLRNMDDLLLNNSFSGFEDYFRVNPGSILGSIKNNPFIYQNMILFDDEIFIQNNNSLNLKTGPKRMTELLVKNGLELKDKYQEISGLSIYPMEYFCPKSWLTKKIIITKNTYSIHHFEGSWNRHQTIKKYFNIINNLFSGKSK